MGLLDIWKNPVFYAMVYFSKVDCDDQPTQFQIRDRGPSFIYKKNLPSPDQNKPWQLLAPL